MLNPLKDKIDCEKSWPKERLFIKMDGLLCPVCRKVLVGRSEPLYKEEHIRRKEAR